MEKNSDTLHNPTLRVINILESLDNAKEGLSLSELSKIIDSPKSTISPIVQTLLAKGYISLNDSTSRYTIGLRSYLLGLSLSSSFKGIDIIKKQMEEIVANCNEVCQLGILIDYDVFYLAKVDPEQPINLVSSVGTKLPAYATALGKSLLSGYPDDEIRHYYKGRLKPITGNTITDVNLLLNQIKDIRSGGVAFEMEEINNDTGCLAIPLRKGNTVIASISVSFPLYRASEEKMESIKNMLREKQEVLELLIRQLDLKI